MAAHKEKENFNNISHGIVGIGSSIAQDVLALCIPWSDLANKVRSHPVWNSLDRNQKLLVSRAVTDGYRNFDITLTYKLLRNVCINLPAPTRGWGKDPQPGDITPSDDLERIRILKNTFYSHLSKPCLPDPEYRDRWQELNDICTRMQTYLGVDYPGELKNIIEDFPEEGIRRLREVLYKASVRLTQQVPLSPVQKSDRKLPIDLIYAPVTIREDLENTHTGDNSDEEKEAAPKSKLVNGPSDMFYKDGETARYVVMQGDAAYGKSVYCLQLLKYWCSAKEPGKSLADLTEWEKGVGEFDFVFPVLLRHVSKNRSLLMDMICFDMFPNNGECYNAIRHVLSSHKYKCLIIIDGLDEWKISPEAKSELTKPCMPNVETLSCCTYFITSRPWKLDQVREILDTSDRVIEIKGLDRKGVKLVIEKVLINFFNMDRSSPEFQTKFREMKRKSKDVKLKFIMQIPMLVTVSTLLWYREEKVTDSMTSFYMALVKLLVKRTYNTTENYQAEFDKMKVKTNLTELDIPKCFQKNKTLQDFIVVLFTLGEVAYNDLVSKETHLVFDRDELKEKIDENILEFALKVGFLSMSEGPGSLGENVSVSFFHKTLQEFLAAVHIVCRSKVESLIRLLSSVKIIQELSGVIIFISGLSPSIGTVLSQHIVHEA